MRVNCLKVFPIKSAAFFILSIILFIITNLFLIASNSEALTITGPDEVTAGSQAQYTAEGCPVSVAWAVTGKGASISQSGLLTVDSSVCGAVTVSAYCPCVIAQKKIRVSNGGQWVGLSMCIIGGLHGDIISTSTITDGDYKWQCEVSFYYWNNYQCNPPYIYCVNTCFCPEGEPFNPYFACSRSLIR